MTYKCFKTGNNCGWNVPADTGGCVCSMPEHQQRSLVEIKQISDYRDLKRVAGLVEAELAFEISKAFPSQSRLDRIADLQNEIRTNA